MKKRDDFFHGRPPTGPCENCSLRTAKHWWGGDSDFNAINHGAPIAGWCALCCLDGELEASRATAARLAVRIPELEAQRVRLVAGEDDDGA